MSLPARRKLDPETVLQVDDILYVAGELDVIEFRGEENSLGLVNLVRAA